MALHEKWSEYSEPEIKKIQKDVCHEHNCPYRRLISTKNEITNMTSYSHFYCNYLMIAGERRGCRPEDCTHYNDKVKKRRMRNTICSPKDWN